MEWQNKLMKKNLFPFLLLSFFLSLFWLIPSCTKKSTLTEEEITKKVKNILQLPTHEMVYRDIIYLDESKTVLMIKTVDRRLLFSVRIRVEAGFDLKEGLEVMVISSSEVLVRLPSPKILLADADESTLEQFFSRETGGAISLLTYYEEIDRKKPALVEDSISRGILFKAQNNGEALIRGVLESLGFTTIRFERLGVTG